MATVVTVEETQQATIDVVHGYMKKMRPLHMPEEITLICLKYYADIEWFSGYRKDSFKASDDKKTITVIKKCDYDDHTIFGNVWIQSCSGIICQWTLKINESYGETYFGLASKYDIHSDFSQEETEYLPNYAVGKYGEVYGNGDEYYLDLAEDSFLFEENSVIVLTLDMINAQFRIQSDSYNNNKELVIADKVQIDDNAKYILAMQLKFEGDSVSLQKFEMLQQ